MTDRDRYVESALTKRVVQQCRVIVDNDFAGDPDGLVALAHHLLSPSNRVDAVTSSFLSPTLLSSGADPGRTAAQGVEAVEALLAVLHLSEAPPVSAGDEGPFTETAEPSPAARAIIDLARQDNDLPLIVACGGPLTNVASALRHDPGISTRFSLVWIGGSLDPAAFEYNRDTDLAAARSVLAAPGLVVHRIPLETYRRCGYSVVEIEEDIGTTGALGRWLADRFQSPPDWIRLSGTWPLGDSPPVLVTALGTESCRTEMSEERGVANYTYLDVDFRLIVGDMLAKLRRHEHRRWSDELAASDQAGSAPTA